MYTKVGANMDTCLSLSYYFNGRFVTKQATWLSSISVNPIKMAKPMSLIRRSECAGWSAAAFVEDVTCNLKVLRPEGLFHRLFDLYHL